MSINQEAKFQIANLIARHIKAYRAVRDINRDREPQEMSLAELSLSVLDDLSNKGKGIYKRLDFEEAHIIGILECIEALGGGKLAIDICDILEQFDEQEASLPFNEHQNYVANYSRLATGVITGWSD